MLSVATDYICASSSLRPNQRENMLPLQILAIIFYVIKIHEYLELSYKQVNAKIQFLSFHNILMLQNLPPSCYLKNYNNLFLVWFSCFSEIQHKASRKNNILEILTQY